MSALWEVIFNQRWQVRSEAILEAYPDEWADAQKRGQTEDEFVRESLHILGDDQMGDVSSDGSEDWEVEKIG